MRRFGYYFLFIILLLGITSFVIPNHFDVPLFKKTPGPLLDQQARTNFRLVLKDQTPDIVIIGDSYLETGIDRDYLSKLTDKKITKIAIPGSASALWYLLLKNNIVSANHKPTYVIILFRGTMLTTPEFRTTGTYLTKIDEFANADDKLLLELAYISQMSNLERIVDQYLPLYEYRHLERLLIDRKLKYPLPKYLFGSKTQEVDEALNNVFGNPDIAMLNEIINDAEAYLYQPEKMDFNSQLRQSFLPEIIRLCQNNGIQLVLVRTKVVEFPTEEQQPDGLEEYTKSLERYLASNNVMFIDLAFNPRISTNFFYDNLHMNEKGRFAFTEIFAEEINSQLP